MCLLSEAFSLGTQTLTPAAKNQRKLVGLVKAGEHRVTSMPWCTFSLILAQVPSYLKLASARVHQCGKGSSGNQCLWTVE